MTVILAEIGYVTAAGAAGTLRLCDGCGYNHPSAPGYYEPRIIRGGGFTRSLWQGGAVVGSAAQMGWGDLLVAHLDADQAGRGANLLWLIGQGCAFDGRPARMLVGADETAVYESFQPWFTGTVEQMIPADQGFTFRFRDALAAITDQPLGSTKYPGGDTELATVDGQDELKDRWRPLLYTRGENIAAVLCNTGKLIYQVSDRAATVTGAYDGGVPLTAGVQRASLALLLSTAPAASHYDWYSGAEGTFVRLGSKPRRGVTVDALEGGTAADRTAAQVWRRILTERCGVEAGSISAADVAALDAAQPAELSGLWVGDGGVARKDALDRVAASVGAAYWVDGGGTWRLRRIAAPAGPADLVLRAVSLEDPAAAGEIDILAFEWLAADGGGLWGVPPHTVTLAYAVNLTVQADADLAGDKSSDTDQVGGLARRDWLAHATRQASSPKDATIAARHLLSTEVTADTLLWSRTAAAAEAGRRQALLAATCRPARCRVPMVPATVAALEAAQTAAVHHRGFGLSGAIFVIAGVEYDHSAGTMDLFLRG